VVHDLRTLQIWFPFLGFFFRCFGGNFTISQISSSKILAARLKNRISVKKNESEETRGKAWGDFLQTAGIDQKRIEDYTKKFVDSGLTTDDILNDEFNFFIVGFNWNR